MRRTLIGVLIIFCLGLAFLDEVRADTYCNCSATESAKHTSCLLGNSDVLWCDDFEDGDWVYTINQSSNPSNDGWSSSVFVQGCGGSGCASGTTFQSITGETSAYGRTGGFGGTYKGYTGIACTTCTQVPVMGSHSINQVLTAPNRHFFIRYYAKWESNHNWNANQKMPLTVNRHGDGPSGIIYGDNHGDSSVAGCVSYYNFVPGHGNISPNGAFTGQRPVCITGNWQFFEHEYDLDNGIYRLYFKDCGAANDQCTGSPDLIMDHTSVSFNSGTCCDFWFEVYNSAPNGGPLTKEASFDQIVAAKTGPIGFLAVASVEKHRLQGGMRLTGTWRIQ